jgi:hypothetical protein
MSSLMRGPDKLFLTIRIIPTFVSFPGEVGEENIVKQVRRDNRDELLTHYLEMFVDEINL